MFVLVAIVLLLLAVASGWFAYKQWKKYTSSKKSPPPSACRPEEDIDVFFMETDADASLKAALSCYENASCPASVHVYIACNAPLVSQLQHPHAHQMFEQRFTSAASSSVLSRLRSCVRAHRPQSRYACLVSSRAAFAPGWDARLVSSIKRRSQLVLTQMLGHHPHVCYPTVSLGDGGLVVSKPHNVQRPSVAASLPSTAASLQFLACLSSTLKQVLRAFKRREEDMDFLSLTSACLSNACRLQIKTQPFVHLRRSAGDRELERGTFHGVRPSRSLLARGIDAEAGRLERKARMGVVDERSTTERISKYFSDTAFELYWSSA